MIKFNVWNCEIKKEKYSDNGRVALQLVAADDDEMNEVYKGEPIAMATVNLPYIPLEKNEVGIKDYSENEGMLKALVNAGVVKDTGKYVLTGFVRIPICKLLI